MLTLQRVRKGSFWLGPAWGAVGLITGSGGGLFVAAVILTFSGRSLLGWDSPSMGLVLTGGGPLALAPWLVAVNSVRHGSQVSRRWVWLVPSWLLGAIAAFAGALLWTANR